MKGSSNLSCRALFEPKCNTNTAPILATSTSRNSVSDVNFTEEPESKHIYEDNSLSWTPDNSVLPKECRWIFSLQGYLTEN